MPSLEIADTGHVYRGDSAYPTLVRLDSGDVLCAFSVGGGPQATGGTEFARSSDGGRTWTWAGVILPRGETPRTTNSLRLSRTADGRLLAYGSRMYPEGGETRFGRKRNEPVLCQSADEGRTWSIPRVIPHDFGCPLEVSNPILALPDGRWLAPAAILPHPDRLGERVVAFESADGGQTWPVTRTLFRHPEARHGYFEQKLVPLDRDRLLAVAWTVELGSYVDQENHFAVSTDAGRTWGPARPTGMFGQTMTPVALGSDRLLVVYNQRHGPQGVRMALVRLEHGDWQVESDAMLWDAANSGAGDGQGIDALRRFQFGLPSAIRLDDRTLLAVHWCVENDRCGIRWTRLILR